MSQLSVAVVVTRLQAGAGGVALRGALAIDPLRYDVTIIAGDSDGGADADGSGGSLLVRAAQAGLHVIRVPELVPQISPINDARALRRLTEQLIAGGYDVVHTHSAKAGALGRVAAGRAGVPRVVHTYHGFPFHEFQSRVRRGAYISVERYLARRTDVFLAVGASVAAEAVRKGVAAPRAGASHQSGHRPPGVNRDSGAPGRRADRPRRTGWLQGCRHGRPGRLPEGTGVLR